MFYCQIEEKDNQIAGYQHREQELLNQLSIPLDKGIQQLLEQLEASHKDLLHNHLAQLKRTYLSVNNITGVNNIIGVNNNTSVNNITETAAAQIFLINPNSGSSNVNGADSVVTIQAGSNTGSNTNVNNVNTSNSTSDNRNVATSDTDIAETNELHEIGGVKIHIVKSADDPDNSVKYESDRDFGIDLDSTYNESISDIKSENIPVENEGTDESPPVKRRKESWAFKLTYLCHTGSSHASGMLAKNVEWWEKYQCKTLWYIWVVWLSPASLWRFQSISWLHGRELHWLSSTSTQSVKMHLKKQNCLMSARFSIIKKRNRSILQIKKWLLLYHL